MAMQPKTQWWENAFQGVVLDVWRQAVSPEQTRSEAEFLAGKLQLKEGDAVLDAPCGEGRISLELAALGCRTTGLDVSADNISRAKEHAQRRNLDITWRQGNMRELPWRSAFDAVLCWGNSFGYFESDGEDVEFVQSLAAAMKPGGRLILQSNVTAEVLFAQEFQAEQRYEIGELTFYSSNRYDPLTSRMHTTDRFIRGDQDVTMAGMQRVYLASDIVRMVREAGLQLKALYGSTDGEPYSIGAGQFILLAERPASAAAR